MGFDVVSFIVVVSVVGALAGALISLGTRTSWWTAALVGWASVWVYLGTVVLALESEVVFAFVLLLLAVAVGLGAYRVRQRRL